MIGRAMLEYAFKSILVTEILLGFSVIALLFFLYLLFKKIKSENIPSLPLITILFIAIGLRVVWILITQPTPESDFSVYWNYANRIYHGDLAYDVIERHPGVVLLYVFSFFFLGPSLTSGWIVNLFFSGVFLLVLYKLTQEIYGRTAGLIAMAIGAILPQLVTYSALMASEIPAVTFLLMVIWAALQNQWQKKHFFFYWFGVGLMLYGAVLIRSTSLLLLGLIPLAMLLARQEDLKSALKGCMVMAITASLLIATWVTHQYLITGIPKLFFGEELWMAFTTQYDHGGSVSSLTRLPYYQRYLAANDGTIQGRLKSYKVLGDESMRIIKRDPLKYLLFGFTRMKNILWGSQTGILWSTKASQIFPGNAKAIRRLSEISTHIWRVLLILATLGLLGFYRLQDKSKLTGHFLVCMFVLCWLAFHFLMAVASERYAFQLLPFVLMLSSTGILNLIGQAVALRSRFLIARA